MTDMQYDFSIIMAVYNVAPYLKDAVDSLLAQTIGFDRVQLILVDDGSTDGSGKLCDEYAMAYPKQIQVLHKQNGGQASARNLGLTLAEGRYINFMDPDDMLSADTLEKVRDFFNAHEDEIDLAAIPMQFFGAQHGPHWQNSKFNRGSRVISLMQEYKVQQTSTASAFYHSRVKSLIHFDERLLNSEDFKVNLTLLCQRPMLGVVSEACYMYRKREAGTSTVDGMTRRKEWYFDWYTYLNDWAYQQYTQTYGYYPAFAQYAVLCDLLWRYQSDYQQAMLMTLNETERLRYLEETKRAVRYFDDQYILELPRLRASHKLLMLRHKYDRMPDVTPIGNQNLLLHYGNTVLMSMNATYCQLDFLRIENDRLTVEGYINLVGATPEDDVAMFVTDGNTEWRCACQTLKHRTQYRLDMMLHRSIGFACTIDMHALREKTALRIGYYYKGCRVLLTKLDTGRFMPVSSRVENSCCRIASWTVRLAQDTLTISSRKADRPSLKDEVKLQCELWKNNKLGMRKAVIVRTLYHLCKPFQRKRIWLFSDRVMRAGDNGEAMFRYVCQHPVKGVKPCFVLHKNSVDYKRMQQIGTVIPYKSVRSRLYHLMAECIVSSAGEVTTRNPFDDRIAYYCDLMPKQKYVFLQHGVTKDDQSAWLNRSAKAIDGFVTSGKGEYDSILHGEGYGYREDQVWLTGMPRYDDLTRDSKRCITIMPTWRQYLMTRYDPDTGLWQMDEDVFQQSEFFQFYAGLLKDERLMRAAKDYGYTIQFFPHPNVIPFIHLFGADPAVKMLHEDTAYRTVFAQSDLIVTDYSSTAFDFAWLYQPVIYAQFDAAQFFSGAHVYQKGYFDYERDGFGEVTHDLDETVRLLVEAMANGCPMKPKYRQRVDDFFAYHDHDNCRRVYERLIRLNEPE